MMSVALVWGVFFSSFFFFRDITLPIARNVCDYIGIVMENATKKQGVSAKSDIVQAEVEIENVKCDKTRPHE
jgi:hypothetical protein